MCDPTLRAGSDPAGGGVAREKAASRRRAPPFAVGPARSEWYLLQGSPWELIRNAEFPAAPIPDLLNPKMNMHFHKSPGDVCAPSSSSCRNVGDEGGLMTPSSAAPSPGGFPAAFGLLPALSWVGPHADSPELSRRGELCVWGLSTAHCKRQSHCLLCLLLLLICLQHTAVATLRMSSRRRQRLKVIRKGFLWIYNSGL